MDPIITVIQLRGSELCTKKAIISSFNFSFMGSVNVQIDARLDKVYLCIEL